MDVFDALAPGQGEVSAVHRNRMMRRAAWLVASVALAASYSLVSPPMAMASAGTFQGGNIDPTNALIAQSQGTAEDGTKIYIISDSYGLISHVCRAIGTYKGVQAVVCSDLYAQPDAFAGKIDVYAIAEAYCQVVTDGSVYPECEWAGAEFSLVMPDGWTSPLSGYTCQAFTAPSCSYTYRNFFEGEQVIAAGACPELWTDVYGGPGVHVTGVSLPGDVDEFTISDLTTARAVIC
jgi:hypothetical protein